MLTTDACVLLQLLGHIELLLEHHLLETTLVPLRRYELGPPYFGLRIEYNLLVVHEILRQPLFELQYITQTLAHSKFIFLSAGPGAHFISSLNGLSNFVLNFHPFFKRKIIVVTLLQRLRVEVSLEKLYESLFRAKDL